ncbi:MAG: NusG domain II-containing protein [Acetivibrionales bacterium]|jgi:hypothetical protein
MLKKGDIILGCCLIIFILVGFVGLKAYKGNGDGINRVAVVKYNSQVVKRVNLDAVEKPERLILDREYHQIVLIEKGRIRFEESDCPDKLCVNTGWLSQRGDTAICAPNKTIIVIEGENSKVDGVTY